MERNVPKLRFKGFNDEWYKGKLKEYVIDFIVPIRDKPKEFSGEIPWCRIEDIEGKYLNTTLSNKYVSIKTIDEMNLKVYPRGTVLCSCSANLGICAITTREVITNQTFIGLVAGNMLYNEFLFYRMITYSNKLKRLSSGTTIAYLSRQEFEELSIKIPSLQEQERIANFLTKVDKIIEKQDEKVKNFEKYKKGMMQKIFSQEIRFKDENGEENPEWEEYKLKELCDFFSGGTPLTSKKQFYNGNIPFVRSAEIASESTELTITESGLKNSSAKMVYKGDLLYALYGATSGEVAISRLNGAINQAVLCIRSNKCNLVFLEKVLINNKQNIIKTYLQGGQGNLSANIIKELEYNFPCLDEQDIIVRFISKIEDILKKETNKLEELIKWKKGLLQQMFV